jgi:EmrB/QacA subfamily drug resistance transporter
MANSNTVPNGRSPGEVQAIKPGIRTAALVVVTLSSFLTPFMSAAINVALPQIGKEFAMDAVVLNWVATSFLLASAIFLVPFGRLADMFGRKRIFTYGILIYTAASLLAPIARSASVLIGFRVIQGIGSAMIFGTGMAILTSIFPKGERGRAMGWNAATVYLGLSLGPFVGGVITQHFGWRGIFFANVPLGLIVIGFLFAKLKGEWAEARGEKFDLAGSGIYALTIVFVMYGLSRLPGPAGIALVILGALGIAGFGVWEMRVKNPVFDLQLFRSNIAFAFSSLAALINYSATAGAGFLLSLYLQYLRGMSPEKAGLVLVAQPVMMAVFSPVAGRLSDRIESRIIASVGMALTASSLFLFIFLGPNTSLWLIVVFLLLLGFGFALFSSPNMNAIMSSVEQRYYGVAGATLATMRLIGQMLSYGIAMLLFAVIVGRVQIKPEYFVPFLRSVKVAFSVFASLCFLGIFASLARGNVRPQRS